MDARISGGRREMGERVFLCVRRLHNAKVNAAISSSRRSWALVVMIGARDVGDVGRFSLTGSKDNFCAE